MLLKALEERNLLKAPNGPGRRRLADRRGPGDGAGAGAAAGAGRKRSAATPQCGAHVPACRAATSPGLDAVLTLLKVAAFVAMACARRPARRALAARAGRAHRARASSSRWPCSRLALGIAFGSAELFGVSFALGAFFAGVVMSESELSHRAAADPLPLQDAFAVLFFVSVGMLFDPSILVRDPDAVIAVLL